MQRCLFLWLLFIASISLYNLFILIKLQLKQLLLDLSMESCLNLFGPYAGTDALVTHKDCVPSSKIGTEITGQCENQSRNHNESLIQYYGTHKFIPKLGKQLANNMMKTNKCLNYVCLQDGQTALDAYLNHQIDRSWIPNLESKMNGAPMLKADAQQNDQVRVINLNGQKLLKFAKDESLKAKYLLNQSIFSAQSQSVQSLPMSSIENIITKYSRKFDIDNNREEGGTKAQKGSISLQQADEKEVNLCQKSPKKVAQNAQDDDCNSISVCSSEGEQGQHADAIWDQYYFELNQQDFKESKLSNDNQHHQPLRIIFSSKVQILEKERSDLSKQVSRLELELAEVRIRASQIQSLNEESKVNFREHQQKYNELIEQNSELNSLVQEYKEEIYRVSQMAKQYSSQIRQLSIEIENCKSISQSREDQIVELISKNKEQFQQNQQMDHIIEDLKAILNKTENYFQMQAKDHQHQMDILREENQFLKQRLDQEGLTLNMDEVQDIKSILQDSVNEAKQQQQTIIATMNANYTIIISQKQALQRKIEQMKVQSIQTANKLEEIIKQYDIELELRNIDIIRLQKDLREANYFKTVQLKVQESAELICYQTQNQTNRNKIKELEEKLSFQEEKRLILHKKLIFFEQYLTFLQESIKNRKDISFQQQNEFLVNQSSALIEKYIKLKRYSKQLESLFLNLLSNQEINNSALVRTYLQRQDQMQMAKDERQNIKPKKIHAIKPLPPTFVYFESNTLSLQKWLQKNKLIDSRKKTQFASQLIRFASSTMQNSGKRKPNLNPSQILITDIEGQLNFSFKKLEKSSQQNKKNMLYRAPQVLLGFGENEQSYVWTVGLIIDELYHEQFFFKSIRHILNHRNNYRCRDSKLELKVLLEMMVNKNQKERPSLQSIAQSLNRCANDACH